MPPRRHAPDILPPRTTRLTVILRSLDHRVVDQTASRLTVHCERLGGVVEGPMPLPSRPSDVEGMRWHVRTLDLVDPAPALLGSLRGFDLPNGVRIEMRA
ncbi:MAG: hypothetical protein FJ033_06820 [Chloroflexi bacterium]|nr:hypothetical protein [Chloroflexota bacterium]